MQIVVNGGLAQGTFASGLNGVQVINSGGVASFTSAGSSGRIYVSGGTMVSARVGSAGTELVFAGGTASDTVISSGGTEIVSSAGRIADVTTLSGGTLEVKTGGSVGSSVIDFAGGGHLVLDNAQAWPLAATISGFGVPGDIDCQDTNIATATLGYATTSVGGILTVSDGTHTAQLVLIGNYSLGSFQKVNDGHGGTLISDPPVSSGQAIAASGP